MRVVGLWYQHIHSCPNDCIIYYGNYKDSQSCPICKTPRYGDGIKGKIVPKGKKLFYVSLDTSLVFFFL